MVDLPDALPRREMEAFFISLTHEIRNHLNGFSLEAADLAEQKGIDLDRLQTLIQQEAAYLKTVRSGLAPETPRITSVRVGDLVAEVQAGVKRLGWVNFCWEKSVLTEKMIRVDPAQVAQALISLLEDAAGRVRQEKTLTSTPETARLRLEEKGVGLTLRLFLPVVRPADLEVWGQTPGAKPGEGLFLRYRATRLLAQNGGSCRWVYDEAEKELIIEADFGT